MSSAYQDIRKSYHSYIFSYFLLRRGFFVCKSSFTKYDTFRYNLQYFTYNYYLMQSHRLPPGVDPRAIQGDCKMGFPPGVGEFNKTKFPWSIASQRKILLISTSYYWDSLLK